MAITETRKASLVSQFFSDNQIDSTGLLNAILSDLNNTSDVTTADIDWIYGSLGSIYSPPTTGLEKPATVVSIESGSSLKVIYTCLEGQVCDPTTYLVSLYGVVTDANSEAPAKAWLQLHLPAGSSVVLKPISTGAIVTKGTENINNSLAEYINNIASVTPLTGTTVMATVYSITDGDTFEAVQKCLAGQLCVNTPFTVRLEGVSSSELQFANGKSARVWLADHIPPGATVKLIISGSDPYARMVARVYDQDNTNINQLMIKEGQAQEWNPFIESFEGKVHIDQKSAQKTCGTVSVVKRPAILDVAPNSNTGVGPQCQAILVGQQTWFTYTVKNIGDSNWRGWLGVILYNSKKAAIYEYTGDPSFASTITPGQIKTLRASFVIPSGLTDIAGWDAVFNSTE